MLKELLKSRFYLVSLQKAKENEFMQLQQGKMSVLEYASKFIKLSCFAPTFYGIWEIEDELLRGGA